MTPKPITAEFGLSLTRYQTSIYAYIMSLVPDRNAAEDVLQETNLVLWEKAEDFEAGSDFLAWACTIARYKALHARRDFARDRHQFSSAVAEQLADRLADRIGELDDRRRALRNCMTKLTAADQSLLESRYRAEGSVADIAERTGRPPAAVSQKLYRLRAILMDCVKQSLVSDAYPMTMPPAQSDRLRHLIAQLSDGVLDDAGWSELDALLGDSSDAQEVYLDHLTHEAMLHREYADTESRSAPYAHFDRAPSSRFMPIAWSLAAAIGLAAASVAGYLLTASPDPDAPTSAPIATLIEATGTVIYEDDVANPGEEYAAGRYSIGSGSAQIFLSNRVTVDLRGRTDLVVHDPMNADLNRGTASFACPPGTAGYTVNLPGGARIIDLGTRFTVRVGVDGEARVVVTEGAVRVEGGPGQPYRLEAGRAVAIAPNGVVAEHAASDIGVIAGRYVHWSFDDADTDRIADHGNGFERGPFDIVLPSDAALSPRFVEGPIGKALELDGRTPLETTFEGIVGTSARTVALWVRVPVNASAANSRGILSWGDPAIAGGMWQMSWNYYAEGHAAGTYGTLRLTTGGKSVITGSTNIRGGRWHHVAIVVEDADSPTLESDVTLYVDGERDAVSRVVSNPIDTRGGVNPVRFGWDLKGFSALRPIASASFRGAIDEVYIIDVALDPEQIKTLYRRKPDSFNEVSNR